MCYLCRKVELLRGVDSIATKTILIALSKLHRHVEPRLGDLWLWRHAETIKLRGLLGSIHRIVPAKALEAIITEVDQDLVHIKKNMADHPPRQNTGPGNSFAATITADQSSSMRMKKERQQGRERRQSDRKARALSTSGGISKSSAGKYLPDLPGSDIHPPSVRMRYSNHLVENWMRNNDALVATDSQMDLDNKSMVSVVGGGISQRPAIDVELWMASVVQDGRDKSSNSGIIDSQLDKNSITQLNNCVYDTPSQDLHLDMRIFDQVAELALKRGTEHQFQRTLSSTLERKKVEKLSSRRKISITEAVRLLHAKQKRRQRADLMCGGRSSGPSTKTSLKTVMNSRRWRTSLEHSLTHSVALNTSEVGQCIENAHVEPKMNEFSSTTSSSLFSSQPPTINLGSLIQYSPSAKEKRPEQDISHQIQTSASSNSSRPSAANLDRNQKRALSSKDQLLKERQRSKESTPKEITQMETSSHKPTVPVPIGRPLSSAGAKDTNRLRRDSRQLLANSSASAAVSRHSKMCASQSVKRVVAGTEEILKDDLPTKSTYVRYFQPRKYDTSDVTQRAIKRRNERRDSMAVVDNGSSTQDWREPSHPILAVRSKPHIFAGSFDPEYVRPKEKRLTQARNTNRTSAERTEPVAIERTRTGDQEGVERPSPNPFNGPQSQHRRKSKEPEISEAVKSSRRRRAERDSMPFNDRYRNEERKKAWTWTMKESSVRM